MKYRFINKIKANLVILSNKKSTNLLDGTYKSIYVGKSFNFENLRLYNVGDEAKDIDWKASSRSGELLVKQYIAEKKHNIMVILDSSIKMDGLASENDTKRIVALYCAGTIGYLAYKNGDYFKIVYGYNDDYTFRKDLWKIELDLEKYNTLKFTNNYSIEKAVKQLIKKVKRKKIVFIISDISGFKNIDERTLRELSHTSTVLCININDKKIKGNRMFDIEEKQNIPSFILNDGMLSKENENIKTKIENLNKEKIQKNKISYISVSSVKEVAPKIIELIERHKRLNGS